MLSAQNTTPEDAAERARAAADAAYKAADAALAAAENVAQALGNTATAATHGAVDPLVFQFAIFVLAIFVGYYVVWSVTPALHTPLMSVTNAISSVIVVGALLAAGVDAAQSSDMAWAQGFGFSAVVLAAINIAGGFLVTSRMLAMYRKKTD
jgi:H+-translocating NAD(P) transhydrogenase subunit alpha